MFGTLRPHRCSLPGADRQQHRHLYCGLCKTMGEDYGQLTRPLVSVDAVLLGVLVDALQDAAAPQSSCRCPIAPHRFRTTIAHDSTTMRFSAAAQVLLTDQWLADRAQDGHTLARLARPLGSPTVQRAWGVLEALGADLSGLVGLETRQATAEATGDAVEAPSASAVRLVFSQIPALPGTAPLDAAQQDALLGLGEALGGLVYGIDALEDLAEDLRDGAFNPCIVEGRVEAARVERTIGQVEDALAQIRTHLDVLPLQRHQALLENILLTRQAQKAEQVSASARALIEAPLPGRLERLWRLLATFWAWIWVMESDEDEEQQRKRRSSCMDCGVFDCSVCCDACDCLSSCQRRGGDGCCDCGGCDVCDCCGGCDCG